MRDVVELIGHCISNIISPAGKVFQSCVSGASQKSNQRANKNVSKEPGF